jgi:formylglycine-generating enzyme required for sulfatase activity
VLPVNATDKGVEWSSSDKSVVNVENGMVTPRFAGNATITVKSTSDDNKSTSCEVEVAEPVPLPAIDTYVYMRGGTIASGNKWAAAKGTMNADNPGAKAPEEGISVAPFHIGKTEVRYELWYIVREWGEGHGYTFKNKGNVGGDGTPGALPVDPEKDEPVAMVSWRDVVVWCNAYSEITGKDAVYRDSSNNVLKDSTQSVESQINESKIVLYNGYRLPTETEWEYAARGGVPGSGEPWTYTYAGSDTVGAVAWHSGNSDNTPHPVGQKTANSAGLYDMSGNVFEWCFDPYPDTFRVFRGGGWFSNETYCSVAYRSSNNPDFVRNRLGFRVVCR